MIRPLGWLRRAPRDAASPPSPCASARPAAARWPACRLELHPVELGEDVVRQVERAVGADVALGAAQHAERRERPRSTAAISSACAPQVVGVEARARHARSACGRRSRRTRSRGRAQPSPSRGPTPSRPTSVVWHVEVAADVATLDERRRLAAERLLAQLRRTPRGCRAARTGLLVGRGLGQLARAPRRTPACRSRARARCRSAPARRRRSSTGTPSTVTPTARRSSRSSTATIAGSASNASSTGPGRAADARPRSRTSVAPSGADRRRPRRRPRPAISSSSARARFEVMPFRRLRRRAHARALGEQALLRLRPDARNRRQPSCARRLAELLGRADAERAPDLDHPLRADTERAAEPDELGLALRVRARRARRCGRSRRARAAVRAIPARSRAAPATRPRRDELCDRRLRLADRLGRSPVRARRVEARRRRGRAAPRRPRAVGDLRVRQPFHRR